MGEILGKVDLDSILRIYLPEEYKIQFSSNEFFIDKQNKKIILPEGYKNLAKIDEILWLIIFVLERQHNKIKEDIDDKGVLTKLEKEQLLKLFEYLKTYHNLWESFIIDKRGKLKQFYKFLSKKIIAKWPLREFIKKTLIELPQLTIDELIDRYLEFKWLYLEDRCKQDWQCWLNEQLEENLTYYEHDWLQMWENIEWEDPWVIWILEPAVNKTYFVKNVLERWSRENMKFYQVNTEKYSIEPDIYGDIITYYKVSGKKWKRYILPLSKDLKIVSFDSNKVNLLKDEYWRYFVEFLVDWEIELWIWRREEKEQFFTEYVKEIIYTGNKIDLSQFSSWKDLKRFIQSKKYKNVSQIGFKRWWVNEYIENLFFADQMDCLPANILFVVLARSLGYLARLVIWYQTYKKDWKLYISTNKWHAWSEIYINWQWLRVDATPVKTDNQINEQDDLDSQVEMIQETWFEGEYNDIEIVEWKQTEIMEALDSLPDIESPYFRSAVEYVKRDAEEIIEYIKNLIEKRKEFLAKQKLRWEPKRKKRWLSTGKLNIDPSVIEKLAVWDPNIFEKNKKLKFKPNEDIDTTLKDIAIAIDVSWSMWSLTWNWESWTKSDYAYLSVVLLYLVAKWLWINFDTVVLFSDEVYKWSPEQVLKDLEKIYSSLGKWNTGNTVWIKTALEAIKGTNKWVVFVISDGDGATWTAFFGKQSRQILKLNKNLYVVWYWIWKDAASKLENKIERWKIPTVIEYRMKEAKNDRQSRWYPLIEYRRVVEQLKKHLEQFMLSKQIKL